MQALLDTIATMELVSDACRIFHGRGGMYPGCEHLTLDVFPPVLVLTSFQPLSEEALSDIGDSLAARWEQLTPGEPLNWVFQVRGLAQARTTLMSGSVPDVHEVTENGARFRVHVLQGQNHGLFLDMAEGRRWVRSQVAASAQRRVGFRVLNLFAYTCAFSVVALQAGARHVVNVDMSHGALAVGQQNHQRNGITAGASFLAHDVFSTWGKITRSGPYDLVIADPPSYQKGSFVATKDYTRLVRRLPDLLMPGGHALLCLNAPELGSAFLMDLVREAAPELTFVQRLANPPVFADVSDERALKVLLYQAPGADASSAMTSPQGSAASAS